MNTQRTREVLEELKTLDLRTYPYEKAKSLMEEVFRFHAMLHIIPKGSAVLRARPNENGKSFSNENELSYKPQEFNKTYQRASTPHHTVFYAGALPDRKETLDLMVIATLEASPLVRKMTSDKNKALSNQIQSETITFGRWEVKKDLPLIAVCYNENFIQKHSLTKGLFKTYSDLLNTLTDEQKEISFKINNFIALEFAKDKIEADYDYLLSAIFTEIAIERGYIGVLYPSVRCEGEGFNVAIAPQFVSEHLKLTAVGESKIYNKNKEYFINHETFTYIDPNQKNFELKSLKGTNMFTDEEIIIASLNDQIDLLNSR